MELRPQESQFVEANAFYVMGYGFLGVVLGKEPTDWATYAYSISEAIKFAASEFRTRKIVCFQDNYSAHLKAEKMIKSRIPRSTAVKKFMLYNLPGLP